MDNGGIRRHRMAGGSTRIFGWLSPRSAVVVCLAAATVGILVVQLMSSPGGSGSPVAGSEADQPGAIQGGGGSPAPDGSPSSQPGTPSPRPGTSPRGITATYAVTRSWDDGFVERITLTNHGSAPQNWTVTLVLPQGTTVTKVWRAEVRQSGTAFEFTRLDRMAPLAAGATVWFGFEAGGAASTDQSCEVNGRPCG
jgi:hypothetical protein